MSTLKVAAINNPSASSGGLAISSAGLVTGAGLDLIVTQSFSAASSVSLNNCFSAVYDNYRIVVALAFSASGQSGRLRVRASGSDLSTSTYYWTVTSGAGTSDTSIKFNVSTGAGDASSLVADITSPFLAAGTGWTSLSNDAAGFGLTSASGGVRNTTSYDGFTLFPSSGTITGSVSVYGYRK